MFNRKQFIKENDPDNILNLETLTDEELQLNLRIPDKVYKDILIDEYPNKYNSNKYQQEVDQKYISKRNFLKEKKEKQLKEKNEKKLKEYEELVHYQHRNSEKEYKVFHHHEYKTYHREDEINKVPKREINFITDKPDNFDNNIFIDLKNILTPSKDINKYKEVKKYLSQVNNINHSRWIERISFVDSISFKELILQNNEESYELISTINDNL